MSRASRIGKTAALTLAGVAYAKSILRRNDALVPIPARRSDGSAFEQDRFEYSDGAAISLIAEGEGPTILWLPGADGVKETWTYQLPAFAERFRVLAPDLRVDFSPTDSFDRFTDDVVELIEAYGTGPVALVGQSLGSAIALRFAVRFPELLAGLILSNPISRITYEHVGFNRVGLVPISIWTTRYLPTRLAELAARIWCRAVVWIYDDSPGCDRLVEYALWTGPRTVRGRVSGERVDRLRGWDLRPRLGDIEAPTLVVKGPEDSYCPAYWAIEIADGIADSRYVEVPGTGHCSHISSPDVFNRALLDWLDERLGPTTADGSGE